MSQPLRIIFAGTPEFAAQHLSAILQAQRYTVVGIYTQPDRPAGRGKKLTPSPVKKLALEHNLPVFQPHSLKTTEAQQELAALNADLMVVVAYGLILPQAVLDTPTLGCINSHASLLPRWRGAAPIQRAIQAGDSQTGITVMQMEAGLDTGPMLLKATTPITENDTGGSLHDRLAELGAQTILQAIDGIAKQQLTAEPQNDKLATYAHKLTKEEALLDWALSAKKIINTIHAFNPWPIAYTLLDGQPLKIHQAEYSQAQGNAGEILEVSKKGLLIGCGEHAVHLTTLQLPNSKPLAFWDIYNGKKELFPLGKVLGK